VARQLLVLCAGRDGAAARTRQVTQAELATRTLRCGGGAASWSCSWTPTRSWPATPSGRPAPASATTPGAPGPGPAVRAAHPGRPLLGDPLTVTARRGPAAAARCVPRPPCPCPGTGRWRAPARGRPRGPGRLLLGDGAGGLHEPSGLVQVAPVGGDPGQHPVGGRGQAGDAAALGLGERLAAAPLHPLQRQRPPVEGQAVHADGVRPPAGVSRISGQLPGPLGRGLGLGQPSPGPVQVGEQVPGLGQAQPAGRGGPPAAARCSAARTRP
jgi:hypothetical protein